MAPHSSTFAWKIPWTEEPGRLQSMWSLESGTTERLHFHFHFSPSCIGEGNGNPVQCSCLENPRDGGALWAPPSMGSHRVGHDWSDLAAAHTYTDVTINAKALNKWLASTSQEYSERIHCGQVDRNLYVGKGLTKSSPLLHENLTLC